MVQPAPVVEYAVQAPDVPFAAAALVVEYDAPAPTMAYRIPENAVADESGLEPEDIKLVMSLVSCSRSKAVSVLRANNNDVLEAITRYFSYEEPAMQAENRDIIEADGK